MFYCLNDDAKIRGSFNKCGNFCIWKWKQEELFRGELYSWKSIVIG